VKEKEIDNEREKAKEIEKVKERRLEARR